MNRVCPVGHYLITAPPPTFTACFILLPPAVRPLHVLKAPREPAIITWSYNRISPGTGKPCPVHVRGIICPKPGNIVAVRVLCEIIERPGPLFTDVPISRMCCLPVISIAFNRFTRKMSGRCRCTGTLLHNKPGCTFMYTGTELPRVSYLRINSRGPNSYDFFQGAGYIARSGVPWHSAGTRSWMY